MTSEKTKGKKQGKKEEEIVEHRLGLDESLGVIKREARVSAVVASAIQNPPPPKNKKPENSESSES